MIANTSRDLKKTVGWIAYVDGAARSLPNAKPFRVMYQMDGRRLHSARVQSVLFANCGSLPAGLELIPEASVSDGELDIVIFQPEGRRSAGLLVWRRVAWDNSVLRRFRAGRRVLALRTEDNSVRYLRGAGARGRDLPGRSRCSSTATSSARPSACAAASSRAASSPPCRRATTCRGSERLRVPGMPASVGPLGSPVTNGATRRRVVTGEQRRCRARLSHIARGAGVL